LPTLLEQAVAGKAMTVYGDGNQSRCFCSVHDVVEGLTRFLEAPNASGTVINLGTQEEVSILGLAQRIKTLTGSQSEIVLVPYDEAYGPGFDDMRRRVPDVSRAAELLQWSPSRTLDEIIQEMKTVLAEASDARKPRAAANADDVSALRFAVQASAR
jgi:UDP-glucose 4-epimerase